MKSVFLKTGINRIDNRLERNRWEILDGFLKVLNEGFRVGFVYSFLELRNDDFV